ncbi:MAG: PD40 domain-containing protein [Ardenticatenaceae bacterium]|nr:PD40 domain-containing protein [Ardenticatenaceae bacterium]
MKKKTILITLIVLLSLAVYAVNSFASATAVSPTARPNLIAITQAAQASLLRVSVSANGTEANGNSSLPTLSADGTIVTFVSDATNLTATATGGMRQVFIKDITSGAVTMASVAAAGVAANNHASDPALDASGRYVAFESQATNLVTGTVNVWLDIFVRDTVLLTTTLISAAADGTPGNAASENPAFSADGRFIVFQSSANNLIADDFSPYVDIFVRDRDTDEDGIFDEPGAVHNVRVSQNASGTAANGVSTDPDISANGRWVVFSSSADNLVAGDTNNANDIFLYDRDADGNGLYDEPGTITVTLISAGMGGVPAAGFSMLPAISPDGTQVAFESFATNLVAGGTAEFRQHIFVRDWQAGVTTLVSQSSTGEEANDWSSTPALSENGRWLVFASAADNLVPADTNFGGDIFVRDRDVDGNGVFDEAGQMATTRISVDSAGGQMDGGQAFNGVISGDGQRIAFDADANDLIANDFNGKSDVFMHQAAGSGMGADVAVSYLGPGTVLGTSSPIRLALQNLGPELASDVKVNTDVFGDYLFFFFWLSPSQGTCIGSRCELGDVPPGETVNFSLAANVNENPTRVYQGSVSVELSASLANEDPNLANNSNTFTTSYYLCSADNACLLDEIVCFLFQHPPVSRLANWGTFIPNLGLYYHVRDEILTTPAGHAYTDLYYRHSDEITDLVFADTNLWNLALDGLFQWEANFTALVAGEGDTAVITAPQIQAVEDFLDALSAAGSPTLQQAIAEERAKLPPFGTFVGLTMAEARGEVVGYGAYLPTVISQ